MVLQSNYDLRPCKSHYVPPSAFKFDPVKFSGTVDNLKTHCKSLKQKYIKGLPKTKTYGLICWCHGWLHLNLTHDIIAK